MCWTCLQWSARDFKISPIRRWRWVPVQTIAIQNPWLWFGGNLISKQPVRTIGFLCTVIFFWKYSTYHTVKTHTLHCRTRLRLDSDQCALVNRLFHTLRARASVRRLRGRQIWRLRLAEVTQDEVLILTRDSDIMSLQSYRQKSASSTGCLSLFQASVYSLRLVDEYSL